MVSFSRLFDLASKAVDKASSSGAGSRPSTGGGRDWRDVVRSAADAVTGDRRGDAPATPAPATTGRYAPPPAAAASGGSAHPGPASPGVSAEALSAEDRAAIARYDYLLRTADPDRIEQMHREAFARLTPAQRAHVRARMDAELAPHERPRSDAPDDLARTATRTEATRPGRMAGLLSKAGRGGLVGAGVVGAGGLLAAVAGGAVVSAVAAPLLAQAGQMGVDFAGLAEGVDVEALASGVDLASLAEGSGIGEWAGGAQDAVNGFGEQLSGFQLPGLDDIL
ncbi:cation-transporting ATPase [Microbacterium sp. Kw_RZR3]|uniref:cation-transporting ATPase n=1 Tax=Microbacterium sp. Kw_RZR3 TaxID=3032903 RepID=UPI0023DA88A8|nr:cation-transporting ATPase [Microbacterium sp. Kw_RZR3]MDF2047226.1 cation-transporting ATPase [Microbacterium sp. Kw_RZR3]